MEEFSFLSLKVVCLPHKNIVTNFFHIKFFKISKLTLFSALQKLTIQTWKWKRDNDKVEYVFAIFIDLLKDFDTINHDLVLAKLQTYGF